MYRVLFFLALIVFVSSCNSDYTPRPTGYFRIDFPEHSYQLFDEPGYPYAFEYPVYARVVKDTSFFEDTPENPYWINIEFPGFDGKIYVSYKAVRNNFDRLIDDAFKMVYTQHTMKASGINDSLMTTPNDISGIFFRLSGNTATAHQFFLTDSTRHFLRGALYFDATPNADSLGVVHDFLQKDMNHLIQTLRWK